MIYFRRTIVTGATPVDKLHAIYEYFNDDYPDFIYLLELILEAGT